MLIGEKNFILYNPQNSTILKFNKSDVIKIDDNYVYLLTKNNLFKIFSVKENKVVKIFKIKKNISGIIEKYKKKIYYSENGDYFDKNLEFKDNYLIYPEKNKVIIYDMKNNIKFRELDNRFGNVEFVQIIGDMLISNSDDMVINIWDWKKGKLLHQFEPYLGKVD